MSTITSINDGHCSLGGIPVPPHLTIENGVKTIEVILAKRVLCQHDAEDILRIYRAVDLLEKEVEKLPELNSQHALQKLIEKVQGITGGINAEGLISLYHLQKCSKMGLPVDQYFTNLASNLHKDQIATHLPYCALEAQFNEEIATHLPNCASEAQFNKDAASLIGPNLSEEVNNILNRKREELQKRESLSKAIANKRSELETLRKNVPQDYPPYLDELLDGGQLDLCEHLIAMGRLSTPEERLIAIKNISFSLLSQIVLQTREAIIQKVEVSMPSYYHNILFLLGNTGAGKSTTLCFLRGDKMVLENFQYDTETNNKQIIGHGSKSCTFLPTAAIVNGFVIVDFPGFNDTHGPIVSLGMEFGLKALVKKYSPRILVLEAIQEKNGKYVGVPDLVSRLDRLLDNKQDCVLGITKYSKDPDFLKIRIIEEQQRKEEEIKLLASIKTLSDLKMPNLQSNIEELQRQLTKIQQEKKEQLKVPLPETPEKAESRLKIKEKEAELLKQIGLKSFIPFSSLEDLDAFPYLTELSGKRAIYASSKQVLDANHRKLLDDRRSDLIKEIESRKSDFKNVQSFQKSVLESGLINTILLQSPEGQLLRLPEIDPDIVREYDKAIVGNYIAKYMKGIIGTLNISPIVQVLNDRRSKASTQKINDYEKKLFNDLENKLSRLTQYILGLLASLPNSTDLREIEKEWKRVQEEQTAPLPKDVFKLPDWLMSLLKVVKAPFRIFDFKKSDIIMKLDPRLSDHLKGFCNELDEMYYVLSSLKDIEKLLQKQEDIEKVLCIVPIDMDSKEALLGSICKKIAQVKSAYGNEDWVKRIGALKEELWLSNPCPSYVNHLLIGLVSSLLDDHVQPMLCSISINDHNAQHNLETAFIKKSGFEDLSHIYVKTKSFKIFEVFPSRFNLESLLEFLKFVWECKIIVQNEFDIPEIVHNLKTVEKPKDVVTEISWWLLTFPEYFGKRISKRSSAPEKQNSLFMSDLTVKSWEDMIQATKTLSPYFRIKDGFAMDLSKPLFRALLADALLQNMQTEKL